MVTLGWLLYRGGLLIQFVYSGTQPVGCYTEVVCLYSGTCILVVTLGWLLYRGGLLIQFVYSGSWLLYRGGLLIQWNLYISGQLAVIQRWFAYTVEPVYSGHPWLAVIQRWSAYTVEPVYSGHPWYTTSWLLYRGGLLVEPVYS